MSEMKQSQQEHFPPSEEKLQQLRNSESYKTMEMKRPKHQSYNLFQKEVKFHRDIVKTQEISELSQKKTRRPVTAKPSSDKSPDKIKILITRPESSNLDRVLLLILIFVSKLNR